jgi:hypothetical protein
VIFNDTKQSVSIELEFSKIAAEKTTEPAAPVQQIGQQQTVPVRQPNQAVQLPENRSLSPNPSSNDEEDEEELPIESEGEEATGHSRSSSSLSQVNQGEPDEDGDFGFQPVQPRRSNR